MKKNMIFAKPSQQKKTFGARSHVRATGGYYWRDFNGLLIEK